MTQADFTNKLLEFIQDSPTSFHTVQNSQQLLQKNGFTELHDTDPWEKPAPGSYYIKRNESSLIAFVIADSPLQTTGLRILGAHTDSPSLKVKPTALQHAHSATQLNVEVYGGPLLHPWFDRELSLAGRVTVQTKIYEIQNFLINFKKPVAIIPNLAIHLDREANTSKSINKQTELAPLVMISEKDTAPDFSTTILAQLKKEHPKTNALTLIGHELFLYDATPPAKTGFHEDFITGPRLDNLLSCYCIIQSLATAKTSCSTLAVLSDHEEVGSVTSSGAQGPFLQSVLERILPDTASRYQCLAKSMLISADNAHALHPNYPDKYDENHLPICNKGPAIKHNANQRYATNSITAAFFRVLAGLADVPTQDFVMRNDMACGSTIGPLVAAETGIKVVDVGIPSLAMHSIRETVGSLDPWLLYKVLIEYGALPADSNLWKGIAG